jgi:glucans biosynthesis protein C
METVKTTNRQYYLDWLRFFCIASLIPFHASITYTHVGIVYVKSGEDNLYFYIIDQFIRFWRMPLLFFIAGISSFFALRVRSHKEYVKERIEKLFVPLIFGILALVSVQSYFRAVTNGFKGSFLEYYPTFFHGFYPKGNFEWGHLWFLVYLLTFSLLLSPILVHVRKNPTKGLPHRIGKLFMNRLTMYVPALFFIFSEAFLRPGWPGLVNLYNDWANFLLYIGFFFLGYIFILQAGAVNIVSKNWIITFFMATVTVVTIFYLETYSPLKPGYNKGYMAMKGLYGLNRYLWVMFFIGFGNRFFTQTGRVLTYVSTFSFPLYIIHFVPVTAFTYFLLPLSISIYIKLTIVVVLSLFVCFISYEFVIRRIPMLRFLFGMKRKKKITENLSATSPVAVSGC